MADPRVQELEDTLRDVLTHIRPQGHPGWELNTCLVTNEQLAKWRRTLEDHCPVCDGTGGDHQIGCQEGES